MKVTVSKKKKSNGHKPLTNNDYTNNSQVVLKTKGTLLIIYMLFVNGKQSYSSLYRLCTSLNKSSFDRALTILKEEKYIINTLAKETYNPMPIELTDAGIAMGPVATQLQTIEKTYFP